MKKILPQVRPLSQLRLFKDNFGELVIWFTRNRGASLPKIRSEDMEFYLIILSRRRTLSLKLLEELRSGKKQPTGCGSSSAIDCSW